VAFAAAFVVRFSVLVTKKCCKLSARLRVLHKVSRALHRTATNAAATKLNKNPHVSLCAAGGTHTLVIVFPHFAMHIRNISLCRCTHLAFFLPQL